MAEWPQKTRWACQFPPILFFLTSSDVKYRQYELIFLELGIVLRRAELDPCLVVEPQFEPGIPGSEENLVRFPLRSVSALMEQSRQVPFFIEDTVLLIDALSKEPERGVGLPGSDTKNWWHNLGANGLLRLLGGMAERSARFRCQVAVYWDSGCQIYERADLNGSIAYTPRISQLAEKDVPRSNPFFFHSVFEPAGSDMTLAEMGANDFSRYDYRRNCARKIVGRINRLPFENAVTWSFLVSRV